MIAKEITKNQISFSSFTDTLTEFTMTCVPTIMRGNTLNMTDVNCINRTPYRKGINKYLTKPFKNASAELKMLLEPLSLFALDQSPKELPKEIPENKSLEKQDTWKRANSDCHEEHGLVECVEKQLQLTQDIHQLSPEEHQEFITVLLIEVARIEKYINEQINNPSLDAFEQRNIRAALHQSVVQICKQLLQYYCDKVQVLNEKGIFSGTANICRLRTQLTMHAEKILNMKSLKKMFMNIKNPKIEDSLERTEECLKFVLQQRTTSAMSEEIAEIIKQMPSINLEGLIPAGLNPSAQSSKQSISPDISTPTDEKVTFDMTESFVSASSELMTNVRRCNSQPQLSYGETVWDEIDENIPNLKRRLSLENKHFSEFKTAMDWEQEHLNETSLQSSNLINQDLYTLLRSRRDDPDLDGLIQDDMPPLIKAVPRDEKRKKAREKLDKQIQELYEKEEAFQKKNSFEIAEPAFDQPTILTAQLSAQAAARTTDVRISKRVKGVDHHLVSKSPQYNDLVGEIDPDLMKQLDKPLFEGKNLAQVFSSFLGSMQSGDTVFDSDTTFTDVPSSVDLSNTVRDGEKRLRNEELCVFDDPPWNKTNYNQWLRQPQKVITLNNEEIYPRTLNLSPASKKDMKDLKYWRYWWKSIIQRDDYLKFLSLQTTDFLTIIFHLFDNEYHEVSELNEDQLALSSWRKDSEGTQEQRNEQKDKKTRVDSAQEKKAFNLQQFQRRLDKMWDAIQMSEEQKIDMAVKYATKESSKEMEKVLGAWEQVSQLIIQRETLMSSLMVFESEASDPNRFFIRGPGNASLRLQEAKTRSMYYEKIEHLDKKLSKQINNIHKKYGEVVTFQDRPYLEKMRYDRIEMLHWLQEVRKLNALHYESRKIGVQLPQMNFKQLMLSDPLFSK